MIKPSQVRNEALRVEDKNLKFRTFLKNRADPDELDAQFSRLHDELFSDYDCCQCNNCCKEYTVFLEQEDIGRIAEHLGLTQEAFTAQYLIEADGTYRIKEQPCGFLSADGKCRIQPCKPSVCAGFPFTKKSDRLASMYSILEFAETCPVIFEMLERLKAIYRFR